MCPLTISGAQIGTIVSFMTCLIVKSFIPILFAVAIAAFVWGVIQFFIFGADEESKREKGRQFIVWGLVALAVMLSVLGLVRILGNTFGILPGGSPTSSGGGSGSGGGIDPADCALDGSCGCPDPTDPFCGAGT